MDNFVWTQEMNTELVRLMDQEGLSASLIAARFNEQFRDVLGERVLTRSAVIGRRHRIANAGGQPVVRRQKKNQPLRVRKPKATPSLPKSAGAIFKPVASPPLPKTSLDEACTLDLATGCRFGVNDPAPGEPHLFCNHKLKAGSSYCEYHHNICWRPFKAKSRHNPAERTAA